MPETLQGIAIFLSPTCPSPGSAALSKMLEDPEGFGFQAIYFLPFPPCSVTL